MTRTKRAKKTNNGGASGKEGRKRRREDGDCGPAKKRKKEEGAFEQRRQATRAWLGSWLDGLLEDAGTDPGLSTAVWQVVNEQLAPVGGANRPSRSKRHVFILSRAIGGEAPRCARLITALALVARVIRALAEEPPSTSDEEPWLQMWLQRLEKGWTNMSVILRQKAEAVADA